MAHACGGAEAFRLDTVPFACDHIPWVRASRLWSLRRVPPAPAPRPGSTGSPAAAGPVLRDRGERGNTLGCHSIVSLGRVRALSSDSSQ